MGYMEIKCSGSGERRKKALVEDWRPFFIQSGPKQIVGKRNENGGRNNQVSSLIDAENT